MEESREIMGIIQDKVTPEFKKWVGYCEKNNKTQIGTYDNPEGYKSNTGTGNYTVFADLYYKKTGINVQGQPWCDCFYDTILIHLFGVQNAKKLVNGFSAYTPTSALHYKQAGRYFKDNPQEGDQIFFHNGTRIYHTGYIYDVKNGIIYTIEGNTSSDKILENEGGCVAYKQYPIGWTNGNKKIDGFGRPDYSVVETYQEGFLRAADGKRWWYQYKDGSYATGWAWLTETTGGTSGWYLFDENGYMLTGYQITSDGKRFILCPEHGIHEGQCMVTDDQGHLIVAEYDMKTKKYLIKKE